jgi:hypothetical protein
VTQHPESKQQNVSTVIVNGPLHRPSRSFFPRLWKISRPELFILFAILFSVLFSTARGQSVINDDQPLVLPEVGSYGLRVLSPNVLELTLITTKGPAPARVSAWDFVDDNFNAALPPASAFAVTAGSNQVAVSSVGFKRRVLYAAQSVRDLRIANEIYLTLNQNIAAGAAVQVTNPDGSLWHDPVKYTVVNDALRYSPAIHVNQAGYMPNYPKKAMVGYYLGSLGEMPIPADAGFDIIDRDTAKVVFHGTLAPRVDEGFSYTPAPYQQVYEADFSAFNTPGNYNLRVDGLGCSFPFRIDDGVAANFARTFAQGLLNQRCGFANEIPFTRYTHDICHNSPAQIPTMDPEFDMTQGFLALVTGDYLDETVQTAPRLSNVAASLYPFVNQGTVDVSGGHHDAGDYSKYTIDSAGLIHFLVFAADSFPGVGALDNMGIPESGDGKSDILQEAKWEADFLAKMQDADGGFYFLVYPKNRQYENNVLPEDGDSQVVWPKTTSVTAAAVAALAEAGSSPLMKAQFPVESAKYLKEARLGWDFLMKAIAKYGKQGAYQKITHYGNEFGHDDELAWAAAALYAATGEAQFQTKLFEFFPDPNATSTRRWSWWKLFEGYGCAVRTYAFAARSGRLPSSKLDPAYLAKCEAEIIGAGDDHARFSEENAYGTSFPDTTKQYRSPGWYFSSERAFDVTVAYQISPKPEYAETVIANCNYEGGSNPLNMPYVTGIGYKRQREVVSQYAWNDRRILPPAGLPQGNIRPGYGYLEAYLAPNTSTSELPYLSYPSDAASTAPYPYYDRWTDMVDTMTEFVVMDQARSLASLSFWMAKSPAGAQPWKPVAGQIVGMDQPFQADKGTVLSLTAPGVDLSKAQVIWETRFLEPAMGNPITITPKYSGDHWIEAEALLPDGRRIVAASNFVASSSMNTPPNSYQSAPLAVTSDMAALYHVDGDLNDATGNNPPLTLNGNVRLDSSNLAWMKDRSGASLRFLDLHDQATVPINTALLSNGSDTTAVELDGMIYVNEFKAYDRDVATIFALVESYNDSYLEFREDKYAGPLVQGGNVFSMGGSALTSVLTKKEWHHIRLAITRTGYEFSLDGKLVASKASNELNNWGRSPSSKLVLGNFDGWLDEITVRSIRTSQALSPAVKLDDRLSGSYSFPQTFPIDPAVAAAQGSTITNVSLYVNGSKIESRSTTPYYFDWTPGAPGTYTVTVKAIDALGHAGTSAPATIVLTATNSAQATLLPLGSRPDGFHVQVSGKAGAKLKIQASENSSSWSDLGSVTITSETGNEFVDTTGATNHRFYRAVSQ